MKEFIISDKEAGMRADRYISRLLSGASKGFIYKMLRKKNIVLNGKKMTGSETLCAKDSIRIYFSDETFKKFASKEAADLLSGAENASKKGLLNDIFDEPPAKDPEDPAPIDARYKKPDIIYEDEDIIIINKPKGRLSQKAAADDYSANEQIIDYLIASGQLKAEDLLVFRPSVVSRLDRNTSGLLIAGKTMKGLKETSRQIREHSIKKYYSAAAAGDIKEAQRIAGYLIKDHEKNQVKVFKKDPGPGSYYIETGFSPAERFGSFTYLSVSLVTGRPHQIRAQLLAMGHPILGDPKYGDSRINGKLEAAFGIKSQMLYAKELIIPGKGTFTAPEPEEFAKLREAVDCL